MNIKYTIYCKNPETKEEVKYMSYFRPSNEPLKNLVKWFDERVKTIASEEKIDVSNIVIRWCIKGNNYCYYLDVLWY